MLPNYNNGSIVNLMCSILKAKNKKAVYKELKILPAKKIKQYKKVLLIIVDGLSYDIAVSQKIMPTLLQGKITSVFPSATSAAMMSMQTAVAPLQHASTGWTMHCKELGMNTTILPFTSLFGHDITGIPFECVIPQKPVSMMIKTSAIMPSEISRTECTKTMYNNARIYPYHSLVGFFKSIKKASQDQSYLKIAYWPMYDAICHQYGKRSNQAMHHIHGIMHAIEKTIKKIDKKTLVIITADHGMIDAESEKIINISWYKEIEECLSMPLLGEPRVAHCYVYPEKAKEFETLVKKKFKKSIIMITRKQILQKQYYGLHQINKQIKHRIGDYVLIMKENYIITQSFLGSHPSVNIGNHGGVSEEEMQAPLFVRF